MIRYALVCDNEDEFEGWFGSSSDYDAQEARGDIACPVCGSLNVRKAPMAPAIARRRGTKDPREVMAALAREVQSHIRENFEHVGQRFADEARAIHEGDAHERPIWGEATPAEVKQLTADGVDVAPLPAPFVPVAPEKLN